MGGPFPSEEEKTKLRRIHLDISIGVDLEDVAREASSDSILKSLSSIEWRIYPPEYIASEKIHCLLDRGDANSRGKDVYDLPLIFEEVSNQELLFAIEKTFKRRNFDVLSLYETADSIDTDALEKSYQQVMAESIDLSFKDCWRKVLAKFQEIDLLKEKNK